MSEKKKVLWVHAFQPTPEEEAQREEAIKNYKYVCWLPESQAVVGDVHAFFNDLADVHMCKDYITKYYKRVEEYFKPTVPTPREDFNPQQFVDELSVSELDVAPKKDELVEDMKHQLDLDEAYKQAGTIIKELEHIRNCYLDFEYDEWKEVGKVMDRAKAIRLLLRNDVSTDIANQHPAEENPNVIIQSLGVYTGEYKEDPSGGFGIHIYNKIGEEVAFLDEAETSSIPDHIRNNPKTLNIYVNERMAD